MLENEVFGILPDGWMEGRMDRKCWIDIWLPFCTSMFGDGKWKMGESARVVLPFFTYSNRGKALAILELHMIFDVCKHLLLVIECVAYSHQLEGFRDLLWDNLLSIQCLL